MRNNHKGHIVLIEKNSVSESCWTDPVRADHDPPVVEWVRGSEKSGRKKS